MMVVLGLLIAACSSDATGTVTPTVPPSTSVPSTTTIPPTTTTTTTALMEVRGADPDLVELVSSVYVGQRSPEMAEVFVGEVDDDTRVAVALAGDDVTLAVADPDWRLVGGWWPSIDMGTSLGDWPKLMLVIGSDARPGHDPLRSQADSIHFVGLTEDGKVTVLGVPRDSWLPVPGQGNMKITSSLLRGGPELTMQALSDASGITFDGYLITGFEGFTNLIEVLGGLDIDVPIDMADRWSKAYLDAGRQVLDPADALAFTRTRKTISGGDFTRQLHGGLALVAAATMVQAMGPEALPDLMGASAGLYWTDLTTEEALQLAAAVVRADLANATNIVAEGRVGTTSGGASIVRLADSAYALFDDMQDGLLDGAGG